MLLLLNATRVHLLISKGPLSAYYMSGAMVVTKDPEVTMRSSCPRVSHSPTWETDIGANIGTWGKNI